MSLQLRRLSYALGAEIIGIDLRKPLGDKSFSEVHSAYLEHCVLLFRGQPLTPAQFIAFGQRFGEIDKLDATAPYRHPEYPEILVNTNDPKGGAQPGLGYGATVWHSDKAGGFPALTTLLRSIEIPKVGGDTMFANLYLAYETLSDGMKKLIDGLYGVYVAGNRNPTMALPLVRVHPETGRKALYVAERVKQLVGMTAEESTPLLQFLCNHAARPQFVYRHQWHKDDLIMWDNRCLNHLAVDDYDKTQIRHLERTNVKGTQSQGYRVAEHH